MNAITFRQAWDYGGPLMWVLAGLSVIAFAVCLYLILAVALRCITYEDCMLLPKGEKIAKILRIREKN